MRRAAVLFAGQLTVLAMLGSGQAAAFGAVAFGLPEDTVKYGFAYGRAWDVATPDEARQLALQRCQTARNSTEVARKTCKLVREFSRECTSLAFDPKDGTLGVGWAVAPAPADAERIAMEKCKSSAGSLRPEFCQLVPTRCDVK